MEMVHSLDEFRSSRSVYGKDFPNFEMLDAKIVSALNQIIQNSQFKKTVSLEEQKAQKEDRFLQGRQIAFMIYDYFRVTGAHDTVFFYADLFSVALHDDNIQEFDTRCDEVLLSMSKIPSDDILESLYKLRVRESAQLKTAGELYDIEIHQKISVPNYQKLKTMVKRSIDQKLRIRNFDARHEKNESAAVMKSRKGIIGVDGGKRTCYQRKEKDQCSQGDRCSSRHTTQDRAQKPEHTAAAPSEPAVSRRRKRSIGGKSIHGSILRQPCRYYLNGTCTRTSCEFIGIRPSANSFKRKRVVRRETRVCFLITKLMNNKTKRLKKGHFPKRRGSEEKGVVAVVKKRITIGLCITRFRCTRFSRNKSFWETRCRKSWNQFKRSDSLSLRYVMRVSGKRKDHRWEK